MRFFGSPKGSGQGAQVVPRVRPVRRAAAQNVWVLRIEHWVLRIISLVFSVGSAYAISQVFAPADGGAVRQIVDFGIAGGFGVLGFFLSRGLAYRLFQREQVWSYVPICLLVESVEIFCNYVMGAVEVPRERWLSQIPAGQQSVVTFLAYIVLSIIPVVVLCLAIMDMDLERRKHGGVEASGGPVGSSSMSAASLAPAGGGSLAGPAVRSTASVVSPVPVRSMPAVSPVPRRQALRPYPTHGAVEPAEPVEPVAASRQVVRPEVAESVEFVEPATSAVSPVPRRQALRPYPTHGAVEPAEPAEPVTASRQAPVRSGVRRVQSQVQALASEEAEEALDPLVEMS